MKTIFNQNKKKTKNIANHEKKNHRSNWPVASKRQKYNAYYLSVALPV